MRSPVLAMLWENWRLTRREVAQRLSIGIVGGSAALVLSDTGATIAVWVLLSQHAMFYMSIAKLTGGRFMDGYRPGFPLHLLYTRPVRTRVIVGAAMMYDAVSGAAMYVASASLLGFAFGQTLPVLSIAMLIVVFRMACLFVQWSTRSRVFQWLGSLGVWGPVIALFNIRAGGSPRQLDFSFAETALMASIGLVSLALTVAGVARQRRGDAGAAIPATKGSGLADWFAGLFRFPCPISSPTRAQVWFELRSGGGLVLIVGVAIAMATPLLFAVSGPIAAVRPYAILVTIIATPAMLLLAGNAFGIRRKPGRSFASVFDATQPYGTARLAGLKVLVRTACLLAALIPVGTSLWASTSLVTGWMGDGQAIAMETAFWELPLSRRAELVGPEAHAVWMWRHSVQEVFRRSTGDQLIALAFVAAIVVAVMVSARAAFTALRTRYPRLLNIVGSLLLLHVFVLVLLVLAEQLGIVSTRVLYAAQELTSWVVVAASVLVTAYLFWTVLAERLLTPRQACGVVLVSAAFGAAWLTVLTAAGAPLSAMPARDAIGMLSPVLLPLVASVLAPWSLSRVRHT